jgi:hypothetical protein
MDTDAFQYCTDRTAGDNTGTRGSRTQHDNAGCGLTLHAVRDAVADARDAEEGLLGLFDTLCNGGGNFLGLAVADADQTVASAAAASVT